MAVKLDWDDVQIVVSVVPSTKCVEGSKESDRMAATAIPFPRAAKWAKDPIKTLKEYQEVAAACLADGEIEFTAPNGELKRVKLAHGVAGTGVTIDGPSIGEMLLSKAKLGIQPELIVTATAKAEAAGILKPDVEKTNPESKKAPKAVRGLGAL